MGFEDLEQKLERFFIKSSAHPIKNQKARIKELALNEYSNENNFSLKKIWFFLINPKNAKSVFSFGFLSLALAIVPFMNNHLYAGEIENNSGLVEVVRNGENIIINGKSKLRVGDEIVVNNNSSALINMKNNFQSEVSGNSKIKIDSKESLFLVEGKTNNKLRSGKILTNKGEVLVNRLSHFSVDVTSSGETKIMPQKNSVMVRNWAGEEIILEAGEEIKLRTDTSLVQKQIPMDLNLSGNQIDAIRSKLFISRTKALNYLEDKFIKKSSTKYTSLESANKTFKSISQILKNSREMDSLLTKENLEMIDLEEIYYRVSSKTKNKQLLGEVKAIEVLLKIIDEKDKVIFADKPSGNISFDRYLIISRIFSAADESDREFGKIIRDQYVISFAKKIFDEELRIDQISALNNEIDQLPKTTMSKFFLLQVKELLAPELQTLLKEKIEKEF